ncbi:hypothetical protein [Paraclostridium bifermentans]|uniref:hypothetical protein n=1 Tax=Paraclostridium bifermentans TaxID=1490 RepID=UPI00359C4956
MNIEFKHLEKLLNCNTHVKLNLLDKDNILEIKANYKVISTLELSNNNLEDNAKLIYDKLINLDGITLYIPKVYIKD